MTTIAANPNPRLTAILRRMRPLKSEISNLKSAPRYNPRPVPLETVLPADAVRGPALRDSAECPVCNKLFAGGAVVASAPDFIHPDEPLLGYSGWCVTFKLFCDHCRHIVSWVRASDASGRHLGEALGSVPGSAPAHGLLRSPREIEKFLRLNPQARGVADVVQ